MLLEDKTAVIYGAGGAIGGAVARAFAREGARLFLTGRDRAKVDADVMAQARGVRLSRGAPVAPEEAVNLTKAALDTAIAGRLTPLIGQRFALERAAEAHAAIESRATTGKTLLEVR